MYPTAVSARRAYVDTPTGQVHYYDTLGEGRPLVLLHQSPTSAMDFFGVFPALQAAGLRVMALDFPGMGMSDALSGPTTIDDFIAATIAVMDHAGVPQADIVGYHTGAHVGVDLAVAAPERVRKLALYGLSIMAPEARQALWDRIVPREQEGAMHKPVPGGQNLVERYALLEGMLGPKTAQHMLVSNLMAGPKMWYGHNAALSHDVTPSFEQVTQPILLITHDGEMLDGATRAAAAMKPGAKLVVLDVKGGMAMDSAPEAFAAAVVAFVND